MDTRPDVSWARARRRLRARSFGLQLVIAACGLSAAACSLDRAPQSSGVESDDDGPIAGFGAIAGSGGIGASAGSGSGGAFAGTAGTAGNSSSSGAAGFGGAAGDDGAGSAAGAGGNAALDAGTDATLDAGPDGYVPGTVGAPCTQDAECSANGSSRTCFSESYFAPLLTLPGGYCGELCNLLESPSCEPGAVCVTIPSFPPIPACMQACSTDADCRVQDGYACKKPFTSMFKVCAL